MRSFVLRMMSAALALVALGAVASAPAGAEEVAGTTCSSDSGLATLSPGLGEVAEIQNISVKGTLRGCTGSTGTTANYVAHLKTDKPITCASVSGEAQTAEGSVVIKWGKGHGNSLGTLSLSGSVFAMWRSFRSSEPCEPSVRKRVIISSRWDTIPALRVSFNAPFGALTLSRPFSTDSLTPRAPSSARMSPTASSGASAC